ncbi:MAG: sigma-54 dependent transcriptional regulator [Pseudomonadota bacterium]
MVSPAPLGDAKPASVPFAPRLAQASVLVVDDEPGMRHFLTRTLGPRCRRVATAADTEEASALLDDERFDVVILDNLMPGDTGIEWLAEQRRAGLFSDAILITAYAEMETVLGALRAGADDFLLKPFRSNQILNAVSRSLDRAALRHENALLRHELAGGRDLLRHRARLIGSSPQMHALSRTIERFAALPSPVIVSGASGTGKEVAARMLHARSPRAERPFVPISCTAFSAEAFQAALFGQTEQAGTAQEGLLIPADGGTLFFDNVAELDPAAQTLLLRLMEEMRFRPVGARRDTSLDVRFVFSTRAPLAPKVEAGLFREDVYYRINVLQVDIPPLRERPQDVLDLTEMFLDTMAREFDVAPLEITPAARAKLLRYPWPGNVRELRNHLERALIHGDLEYGLDLIADDGATDSLSAVERRHILETLEKVGGNRAEAARRLGVSRKTIDRKCQTWGI